MKKQNICCLIINFVIIALFICYTVTSMKGIHTSQEIDNLFNIYRLIIGILSIALLIISVLYTKSYKDKYNIIPHGYISIIIGAIFNIIGLLTIGIILNTVGGLFALFNKKTSEKEVE